jgi:large subunit ribosomal protein L7/L12
MAADLASIVERLSELTVMEAADLSRMLEEKWGVSAAAPVAQAPVEQTTQAAPVEAQTEFTVILASVQPDKKINVIKEVRSITGLGLKEAKDFTESAGPGKVIKESATKDEAETMKKRLEDAGATAEIR